MQLTKTDFIQYLKCPKSLWVLKRQPDLYPQGEFSAFLKKLAREGYDVERYVRQLFEAQGRDVTFQDVFTTAAGLYARADVVEVTADRRVILYEVKSSTRIKTDDEQDHIKDACFQKICAERAGLTVDQVFIIHLNADYERKGEVDPEKLLTFVDVSGEVAALTAQTGLEIDAALKFLSEDRLDLNGCSCIQKSRALHCDTFSLFNPHIPKSSIYVLPRLSAAKRNDLVAKKVFALLDVPEGYGLSPTQAIVLTSAKGGAPQINLQAIEKFLVRLRYPLHFFDFETYGSAVPIIDGGKPHKQFPVQYSLHVLKADGSLHHREFLEREPRAPDRLVAQMQNDISTEGSIIAWHASFEAGHIKEMAKQFPNASAFLEGLRGRMIDLEEIFKEDYVDARFEGSTSIKKVLPVICPDLSYKDLEVQDGSSAMEKWEKLISMTGREADKAAASLLRYCERDTYAMVKIYGFLRTLIDNNGGRAGMEAGQNDGKTAPHI